MNKNKALSVLTDLVDFYFQHHEEDDLGEDKIEIEHAEQFIKDNLEDKDFVAKLGIKELTDIKADGIEIDNWSIDREYAGNSGKEYLVAYAGQYYLIQTDTDDVIVSGQLVDVELARQDISSFIGKSIDDYENNLEETEGGEQD